MITQALTSPEDPSQSETAKLSTLPVSIPEFQLADLERRLRSSPSKPTRLSLRVALAWHLRQRDTRRAVTLADEALQDLKPGEASFRGRCNLVLAEAAWLRAELETSERLLKDALDLFGRCGDSCGTSDTLSLSAHVAIDRGQLADARKHMAQAAHWAQLAGDAARQRGAEAVLANWSLMDDAGAADAERLSVVSALLDTDDPRVVMWAHEYFGHLHARLGRHTQSLASFSNAYQHAMLAGQVRRAIVSCTNVAAGYSNLNDHDAALEWIERGSALAQAAGWPSPLGTCLMMLGNTLFLVERLEPAKVALDNAIDVLSALPGSRGLMVAKAILVDVVLGLGDTATAVRMAEDVIRAAEVMDLEDLRCDTRRALAQALLRDGQRERARTEAELSLAESEAQRSPTRCFHALMVLAEIHAPSDGGKPEAGRRSLPHLLRALEACESVEGARVPVDVLEMTAAELALSGAAEKALALALRANAARDAAQSQAATDRALVLEARSQVARVREDAERLREQARSQVERAELWRAANLTLERLGEFGRAITGKLTLQSILEVLDSQFSHVTKASHVSIWLPDPDENSLHLFVSLEGGTPLPTFSVAKNSPTSLVARCFSSRLEILHREADGETGPPLIPGTLPMRWARFGPLIVHDRIVGVLSAQGELPVVEAQLEHEQLVFRSLCNWVAIAVDNAQVCEELEQARSHLQQASLAESQARAAAELAHRQKSAFLANISHDLRTPLAALHGYLETVALKPNDLPRTDQLRYLSTASALCRKVSRMADDLAELAGAESGSLSPRVQRCSLKMLVLDVFARVGLLAVSRSQRLSHRFGNALPDALADGVAVERVLCNLVENAILHAPEGSEVHVEVQAIGTHLEVTVADTGPGLPIEVRERLVAQPPQVTNAARSGGVRLGLLIVRHLLEQHGSRIRVDERDGFGAVLSFSLPVASAVLG